MRVRQANAADVPAMMDLDRESPTAAHWSRQQYEDLFLITSDRSKHFAWVVEDEAEALSGNIAREILAFLAAQRVDAEWELENIVVAGTARRRGLGARLLAELIAHARAEQGSHIFLEVRESNQSARALYRKLGFEETGLRKSYYFDAPEDAILYRLRLY